MINTKLVIIFSLVFLLLICFTKNVKEHFSCMSRYYYKDEEDKFIPSLDQFCWEFTDEECADFKEECIVTNIDYNKLKSENSDEVNDMLESMIHTCMSPNPDVIINNKCLKSELNKSRQLSSGLRRKKRNVGNRVSSHSYNDIMKKCRIQPNSSYKKYVLDKNCDLF